MITFYKEYMIQYNERPVQDSYSKQNERPKQIVVTSIVANGNFHCMYGERIYDSLEDVKHDIDEGRYAYYCYSCFFCYRLCHYLPCIQGEWYFPCWDRPRKE